VDSFGMNLGSDISSNSFSDSLLPYYNCFGQRLIPNLSEEWLKKIRKQCLTKSKSPTKGVALQAGKGSASKGQTSSSQAPPVAKAVTSTALKEGASSKGGAKKKKKTLEM